MNPTEGNMQVNVSMDEKIDMMLNTMNSLLLEIKEIRKENRECYDKVKELEMENAKKEMEIEKLRTKVEQLEKLDGKVEQLERNKRKNNIIITGIDIKIDNPKREIENFMKTHFKLNISTREVHKIGDKRYVVELESLGKKLEVMNTKGRIKYLKDNKIYIGNDLTENERHIQTEIRKIAKEEKEKGHSVKVGYQYLTIDSTKWKWNRENKQLELNSMEKTGNQRVPKN